MISTMSEPPVVLVTGANGFVGFAVIIALLKAGVSVFLVVWRKKSIVSMRVHSVYGATKLDRSNVSSFIGLM